MKLLEKDPRNRIGNKQGVIEILTHSWFKDIDFESVMTRNDKPPYIPDPLRYNFDEEEFSKGDEEFRKEYNENLQREYSPSKVSANVF